MVMRFTWLFLSIVACLLSLNRGFSQTQELTFGASGVEGIPDTAYFGDVINLEFWLHNTTPYPTTIDGLLEITFATDSNVVSGGTSFLATATQSSFSPLFLYLPFQDSIKVTFPETIDNRFAPGDNITVVWPKVVNNLPITTEFSITKVYVMGFHSSIENKLEEASIFPNPAHNFIHFKNTSTSEFGDVFIYDAIGNLILFQEKHFLSNPFSIKRLKPGVYFVQICKEKGYLEKRVIKLTKY